MSEKIIIDAEGAVLGRLASFAAKQSLLGKSIIIVNCEKALITGRKRFIIGEYKEKRRRGGSSRKGPHFPKSSERIVKRTVRGMLPYTQERGLSAFKRIICYDKVPVEYESSKKIKMIRELKTRTLALAEVSREL
ncbi:MAG: 50S ribosomal protein L13 [archaeon]|nr:50S ribosomal protein L13 [archaeon]